MSDLPSACPMCGNKPLVRRYGRVWCQHCGYIVREPEPDEPLPEFA